MSTITDSGRKRALDRTGIRLLPAAAEGSTRIIAESASWGPFTEGDYITISVTEATYLRTGPADVVAAASDVPLHAGVHDFVIPTGVTHVALFSAISGAEASIWSS